MPNNTNGCDPQQTQKDAMTLFKALQQTRTPVTINLTSIVQPGQKVNTVQKQFQRIKLRNDLNITTTTTTVGYTGPRIARTPQSLPASTPEGKGRGTSSPGSMKAIGWHPGDSNGKDHGVGVASTPATPRRSKRARQPNSKKSAYSETDSDGEMASDHSASDFVDDTDLDGAGLGSQMSSPKRRKSAFGGKPVARKRSLDVDEDWH